MGIELKNLSSNATKVSQPGVISFDIPSSKSVVVEDVVKKVKVPTNSGEVLVDDVTSAFSICKAAVKDFGKPGLEFEFEGRRYFYLGDEELPSPPPSLFSYETVDVPPFLAEGSGDSQEKESNFGWGDVEGEEEKKDDESPNLE